MTKTAQNHEYHTTSDAYLGTLEDVMDHPDYVTSPRGMPIHEKLNYTFYVDNPSCDSITTLSSRRNKVIDEYTLKEAALYNSLSDKCSDYEKISSFWKKLKNPDGTINSAYGKLIFGMHDQGDSGFDSDHISRTPWQWALKSLVTDRDTRQAILRFNRSSHLYSGNNDVVCTMYGIFHIRRDKLNLTMHMRSNDVFYGLVYDMPWFCSLIFRMISDLKDHGVTVFPGRYIHNVDSLHAYKRNFSEIYEMLGREWHEDPK